MRNRASVNAPLRVNLLNIHITCESLLRVKSIQVKIISNLKSKLRKNSILELFIFQDRLHKSLDKCFQREILIQHSSLKENQNSTNT